MIGEDGVAAAIATWCVAHKNAGFSDDTKVVVRSFDPAIGTEVVCLLSDETGISEAYMQAAGHYDSKSLSFGSEEEWECAGGAVVSVVMPDGREATALATFDDCDGSEAWGNAWEIEWSREQRRYVGESPYNWNENFGQEDGEEEATIREIERQAAGLLNDWSGRTNLIEHAGGRSQEVNPGLGGQNIRRRVFRWGFLETPIVVGGETDLALQGIGQSQLGVLRISHLQGMAAPDAVEVILDTDLLLRVADKWSLFGGNINLLIEATIDDEDSADISFLVPGFIPMGVTSVLGGDPKIGKSTLAHDLVLLVGTPPEKREADRTWLGVPAAAIPHGAAVYLSGEEPRKWMKARRKTLGGEEAKLAHQFSLVGKDQKFKDWLLDGVAMMPGLTLIVLDPIRKFFEGDENDSAVVDAVLDKVGGIAQTAQCAVLVLHHTTKGNRARNPGEVIDSMRGSMVYKASARALIGMLKRSDAISIGVPDHNVPPPYLMQEETKVFRQLKDSLRLVPISGAASEGVRSNLTGGVPADQEVACVVAAIAAASRRDVKVMRSGRKFGIAELAQKGELPELVGMGRNKIRDATKRALDRGAISLTSDLNLILAEAQNEDVPAVAGACSVNAATQSTSGDNVANSMG